MGGGPRGRCYVPDIYTAKIQLSLGLRGTLDHKGALSGQGGEKRPADASLPM